MLFNSIPFLFFFIIVTSIYFLIPFKFRWGLLLAASCFFYMFFKPEYILILLFTIVIDYIAGIYLEKIEDHAQKRKFLIMSFIANIGVLAVFKYYNFLNDNITGVAHLFGFTNHIPFLKMALPIGLSFHTFQAMSYTIEVYRGNQKAERHFGIYALYVMFYPQLVAGPIERPQNMLHQFREKKYFNYDNAVWGLNLIAYGLFKKLVVADRLSVYVDQVFGNVAGANTSSMLIALFLYYFQIYCDFSAYSDIARGTAKFMGYDLMINFNRPYLSKNISEYWRRWHISLGSWFSDYLYTPLATAKRDWGKWGVIFALLITFLIAGLWHGAAWNFVIFGLLQGVALSYEFLTRKWRKKLASKIPSAIYTWGSIAMAFSYWCVGLIFFRSPTFAIATKVIHKIAELNFKFNLAQLCGDKGPLNLVLSFVVVFSLMLRFLLPKDLKMRYSAVFLTVITLGIIILGKNVAAEFIYFQF